MAGRTRNRLRVLRAEREVTQIEVARRTGIQMTRYWRIEKGYDAPTDAERARLAKALRVDESELGFSAEAARAS